MIDNFIIFVILYITAFILGMFVEWVLSRPEPPKDPVDLDEIISEFDNKKVDMKEWKKCIKECEAYYRGDGKIVDQEPVKDVKKPKKKNDRRQSRTKATNSKTKK
jgi:hypothetical protein